MLTLEEIFHGTRKNVKVIRNVVDAETKLVKEEEKTFNVRVKPGMTRITFPEEGHQSVNSSPGDVVFVIQAEPHPRFVLLNGVDLVYTARITTQQSETGCELTIPTLENDPIMLTIEEEITEDMQEEISSRGMPFPDNTRKRGTLIVKFKVDDRETTELNKVKKPVVSNENKIISGNDCVVFSNLQVEFFRI